MICNILFCLLCLLCVVTGNVLPSPDRQQKTHLVGDDVLARSDTSAPAPAFVKAEATTDVLRESPADRKNEESSVARVSVSSPSDLKRRIRRGLLLSGSDESERLSARMPSGGVSTNGELQEVPHLRRRDARAPPLPPPPPQHDLPPPLGHLQLRRLRFRMGWSLPGWRRDVVTIAAGGSKFKPAPRGQTGPPKKPPSSRPLWLRTDWILPRWGLRGVDEHAKNAPSKSAPHAQPGPPTPPRHRHPPRLSRSLLPLRFRGVNTHANGHQGKPAPPDDPPYGSHRPPRLGRSLPLLRSREANSGSNSAGSPPPSGSHPDHPPPRLMGRSVPLHPRDAKPGSDPGGPSPPPPPNDPLPPPPPRVARSLLPSLHLRDADMGSKPGGTGSSSHSGSHPNDSPPPPPRSMGRSLPLLGTRDALADASPADSKSPYDPSQPNPAQPPPRRMSRSPTSLDRRNAIADASPPGLQPPPYWKSLPDLSGHDPLHPPPRRVGRSLPALDRRDPNTGSNPAGSPPSAPDHPPPRLGRSVPSLGPRDALADAPSDFPGPAGPVGHNSWQPPPRRADISPSPLGRRDASPDSQPPPHSKSPPNFSVTGPPGFDPAGPDPWGRPPRRAGRSPSPLAPRDALADASLPDSQPAPNFPLDHPPPRRRDAIADAAPPDSQPPPPPNSPPDFSGSDPPRHDPGRPPRRRLGRSLSPLGPRDAIADATPPDSKQIPDPGKNPWIGSRGTALSPRTPDIDVHPAHSHDKLHPPRSESVPPHPDDGGSFTNWKRSEHLPPPDDYKGTWKRSQPPPPHDGAKSIWKRYSCTPGANLPGCSGSPAPTGIPSNCVDHGNFYSCGTQPAVDPLASPNDFGNLFDCVSVCNLFVCTRKEAEDVPALKN